MGLSQTKMRGIALFLLCVSLSAFADSTSEHWNWGVGCPPDGTAFSGGAFAASTSSGFAAAGSCARTSTHFTQFSFTSSSGGTANSSTLYGVNTGDWLIIPPTVSTETTPIYAIATQCPFNNKTLNWIFIQWDSGTRTMTNTYVLGTATYSTSSGISVTGQYDVSGAAYYLGVDPMPGSCSNGIYTVSGSADLSGTVYFAMDGAGVYKTTPGHATFFVPQYSVNASTDLGHLTNIQGMSFDSYQTNGAGTRNVSVSTDSTGRYFTVQPYSDPNAGTTDPTYTDTITITQTNSPQPGMLIGTVTRSSGGSADIACIVNRSLDLRVICSGPSPANNAYPYTVTFVEEGVHVLGQLDTMSQSNVALGLDSPYGAFSDGTRLYMADTTNNRVLIWNTIPTVAGADPSVVLGQADFVGNVANNGGVSATSLDAPVAVYSDGTRVFVADKGNSRVLIWHNIPTANATPASLVLGQPNMTSNGTGVSATSLNQPYSIYSNGTRLFVADTSNNRVLIWNSMPTTNDSSANLVLGQPNMTSGSSNNGGISASSMSNPHSVYGDGTKLYVADEINNRILIWNTLPTSGTAAPNVVVGQSNMTSGSINLGNGLSVASAPSLYYPGAVNSDGTRLYVADYMNSRILIWNTIPTTNKASANLVLGQPNMTTDTPNGFSASASNFYDPTSAYGDGTRIYVVDSNENRVLIWNTIPTGNGSVANLSSGNPL